MEALLIIVGFGTVGVLVLAGVARLASGNDDPQRGREHLTDPTRLCDSHSPECGCEACRVGY